MNNALVRILAAKEEEVRRLKTNGGLNHEVAPPGPIRDFKAAIAAPQEIRLIAEIKFASPSAGIICRDRDVLGMGKIYQEAGAAALSHVTDRTFFQGDLAALPGLKEEVALPILRKDFILDEIQLFESLAYGADAVLLIARVLPPKRLKDLLAASGELGLAALVEVHDRQDLERAVACGAELIGINNRDLDTFSVDLRRTLEIAPLVPEECILVSESGIGNGHDLQKLKDGGISAVLVGSALMRSRDPLRRATELVEAGRS